MSDSTPRRKPIPKRLRFEILRRDKYACRYCGRMAPDVKLTVDHVLPDVLGGTNDPSNLVAACSDCNGGKTSVAPDQEVVDDVKSDALRWKVAMEYAAALSASEVDAVEESLAWFTETWERWRTHDERTLPRAPDWMNTVAIWVKAGLTRDDLEYGVRIAMTRNHVSYANKWRYFCGIMWRRLNERQAEARRIIDLGIV